MGEAIFTQSQMEMVRESPYIGWPPHRSGRVQEGLVGVGKRLGICQPLCGVLNKGRDHDLTFMTRSMFPGARSTGSAFYESERAVASGLFSFHTGPGQNKCFRKTYCFLLSYLVSSPTSSISKSAYSSYAL